MTEKNILAAILHDEWMMERIYAVNRLNLPDWWIGAGFIRGKVWDILHKYKTRTPIPDIDVIYYDKKNLSTTIEALAERRLHTFFSSDSWQVRNQARMHEQKGERQYRNAIDGLKRWIEIPTCIGVTFRDNVLLLEAPYGIHDLVNFIVRPAPYGQEHISLYKKRMQEKRWDVLWPKLRIYNK